ncbi:hypothetical protein H9P43_003209 [Blastocladiella emersonii ATCC 22665]|nr:hypothetical protein H9P43_003209 [Blastocladiella emersonii ATCC 22665]
MQKDFVKPLVVSDWSDSQKSIPSPPGFALHTGPRGGLKSTSTRSAAPRSEADQQKQTALRTKKAWDIAYSGAKSLPMNLLMMYMTGNSLQIFSIFFTVMMFWNPVKALMSIDSVFKPIARSGTVSLFLPKLTFVALQLANVLVALYKCQQMGLLPTTESDWLAFTEGHMPAATSFGHFGL